MIYPMELSTPEQLRSTVDYWKRRAEAARQMGDGANERIALQFAAEQEVYLERAGEKPELPI